ncbi:MAG: release factor H-coupled RctB family protein [Francisellaceae bacterium]|nr:release factor H-coupled RctB family protein [Francisellaceae bacterium]
MSIKQIANNISLIATDKCWIEGEALQQLKNVASWAGMQNVVGMPDLHPGKNCPIGASFLSKDWVYPALIGNDIGCGMGLWQLDLPPDKIKLDKLEKKLNKLELPLPRLNTEIINLLTTHAIKPSNFNKSLGSIGGGNHFAELIALNSIENDSLFRDTELNDRSTFLLVHSGSRGYGESILQEQLGSAFSKGLLGTSMEATHYFDQHDNALRWAKLNRNLIAEAFLDVLNVSAQPILDVFHNFLEKLGDDLYLHRKGATPVNQGMVIIPGSRGTLSYLVLPNPQAHGYSIAHGAGRKWKRSECKSRLKERFSIDSLRRTKLGSRIICDDKDLLFEEAPQAYKTIDDVIETLVLANSCKIIATFKPLITYKKGVHK